MLVPFLCPVRRLTILAMRIMKCSLTLQVYISMTLSMVGPGDHDFTVPPKAQRGAVSQVSRRQLNSVVSTACFSAKAAVRIA